jgi:hypothetical protein
MTGKAGKMRSEMLCEKKDGPGKRCSGRRKNHDMQGHGHDVGKSLSQ